VDGSSQTKDTRPPAPGLARVVAATVDGEPIYLDQVEREMAVALGKRPVDPNARPGLLAATLEQLIQRQLALKWLSSTGQVAGEQDVNATVQRLADRLAPRGLTLVQYCRDQGLTDTELRQALRWQLSWQKTLDRYMTEDNLQRYFEQHRHDFDGSRRRVRQILWKVADPQDKEQAARVVEEAQRVRQDITSGRLTFAEAAAKYSQAPSAAAEGDIGYISRHEPMPESFSRAVFDLPRNEVSAPVVTGIGVHLITWVEEQAGNRTWSEVRPALEVAVAAHLLNWAANLARKQAVIQYKGVLPGPSQTDCGSGEAGSRY
jgi:parvulin-like peptidyl-prolyl isomerase